MAYADARHTQRNVSTVVAVAGIEAGLALALIAGLSYTYSTLPDRHLPTTVITTDPPTIDPPIDPPETKPDTPRVIDRPIDIRDPVDVGTAPQTGLTGAGDGLSGGEGVGTAVFPTPIPSPVPSFAAVKAKPRGNPANWVTENDYPTSAIRAEQQGRTSFRLSLDAAGKVTGCTVTMSSGSPALDTATCDKLTRRAKFEAAIDSTGARTEGFYLGSVNWRLPDE